MILAYLPVLGAIAFTMWANANYAYAHGGSLEAQIAMVVLALTIDLAKATFLPAASYHWHHGRRIAASLLAILWLPAMTYSTFAGYAFLTTNRASTAEAATAKAEARSLAQSDYQRLGIDLDAAKSSRDWQVTAACTRPRDRTQRSFCSRVGKLETKLNDASSRLSALPPVEANPEITTLADVSGWSLANIKFGVALFPALLVELLAGLGLYALRRAPKPLRAHQDDFTDMKAAALTQRPKNTTTSPFLAPKPHSKSKPTWKIPASP